MPRWVGLMAVATLMFGAEIGVCRAQTYGDAPWCAVLAVTNGEVVWQCYYHSIEECAPHVIGGTRGFCNVNPYLSRSAVPPRHPGHWAWKPPRH